MIKRILLIAFLIGCVTIYSCAQVSVEQCVSLALENYPLIRKYGLLHQSRQVKLSDINKSWIPQIGVYGQGTIQNAVPSFPEDLSNVLTGMGTDMSGLGKLQYKAGLDISQTIWDGGVSEACREMAETAVAEQTAALDVQLYAIRERVESLFFGIILIEHQIKQTEQTRTLLNNSLEMLRSMKTNGTAMQSDVDMVEAQLLTVGQQIIQADGQLRNYRRLLGIYTGRDMTGEELMKPSPSMPGDLTSGRPELSLFSARMRSNEARLGNIRSSVMPKIGFFAQAYYGYPGFDYFKSMMNRDLSVNLLAGVKVSWNIGPFYTKKNDERKVRLANEEISTDRDVFMFNTNLQIQSQMAHISELEDIMKEDSRIVDLRTNVRRAAESQLENGVIDATALLAKITDENLARLASSYHEIQLIQSICQLKYILNR